MVKNKYIKTQTPKICLAAVKKNGNDLRYVKEQTPEVRLVAVKKMVMIYDMSKSKL